MLNVYLSKESIRGKKLIECNDAWFNIHNQEYDLSTPENRKILLDVDSATYIRSGFVESNFCGKCVIRTEQLSTGCKTLLNIMNCKDKVFNIIECGDNVIDMIFELTEGSIFIPAFIIIIAYNDDKVNLISSNKKVVTIEELGEEVRRTYADE